MRTNNMALFLTLSLVTSVWLSACSQSSAPSDATWQYVAIGDSFTGMGYWPSIYASHIEQDLGVEVELQVRWKGGWNHASMLRALGTDEELRQLIRNAEVITISYGPGSLDAPESFYLSGSCGGDDNQDCLRDGVQKAQQDWDAILDEIAALRSPSEALVRTFKYGTWPYPVLYAGKASPEELHVMIGYFLELNSFVGESALQHGIPVIDAGEALMGPGYQNPIPEEYMQADRMHLSEQGGALIAGLLRDLGYERSSRQ